MEFLSMGWENQMGVIPEGFVPSDLPGLELWTRFNQGITVTGSGVSQWDDVSGNDNHLLQGTDTNRPSKEADGSILFDGVDNFLKAASFTLIQPETVYIFGKQVTWTLNATLFDGDAVNGLRLWNRTTTPNVSIGVVADNSDFILDTYAALAAVFNSTNSLIQVNNNSPTTGDFGLVNAGGFTLGTWGTDGTRASNIQVKEVLIYSTAHDAATRAQVINYLNGVGGL